MGSVELIWHGWTILSQLLQLDGIEPFSVPVFWPNAMSMSLNMWSSEAMLCGTKMHLTAVLHPDPSPDLS